MENIIKFLEEKHTDIKPIIDSFALEQEFSSHDFIEKFSAKFEYNYINMLNLYHKEKDGKAFQTVHKMIAKFLSLNKVRLGIEKTKVKGSENVHGNNSNVHWWKRVS